VLSDLDNFGTAVNIFDEFQEGEKVYLMMWATGEDAGTGARAMAFLRPTADSPNTEVHADLTTSCNPDTGEGILDFTAAFQEPLVIPAGQTLISWSDVDTDGLGNTFFRNNVDRVLLAFYAGRTPEMLASEIFDLEMIATDMWDISTSEGARTVNLLNAIHLDADGQREDGVFFEGFDGYPEGTWILGLLCTFCQNPAPLVLTVLDPG
jgi:hypothetical protein